MNWRKSIFTTKWRIWRLEFFISLILTIIQIIILPDLIHDIFYKYKLSSAFEWPIWFLCFSFFLLILLLQSIKREYDIDKDWGSIIRAYLAIFLFYPLIILFGIYWFVFIFLLIAIYLYIFLETLYLLRKEWIKWHNQFWPDLNQKEIKSKKTNLDN